jgi:hypothetical protein
VEELYDIYMRVQIAQAEWRDCVQWAVDRLLADEHESNVDVVTLAGARKGDDVSDLVVRVLRAHLPAAQRDDEYWAGQYIVELYNQFQRGEIDIPRLDTLLSLVAGTVGYPDWMTILLRNCEYATDVSVFQPWFRKEFDYIAGLWRVCRSADEFHARYDPRISRAHDYP